MARSATVGRGWAIAHAAPGEAAAGLRSRPTTRRCPPLDGHSPTATLATSPATTPSPATSTPHRTAARLGTPSPSGTAPSVSSSTSTGPTQRLHRPDTQRNRQVQGIDGTVTARTAAHEPCRSRSLTGTHRPHLGVRRVSWVRDNARRSLGAPSGVAGALRSFGVPKRREALQPGVLGVLARTCVETCARVHVGVSARVGTWVAAGDDHGVLVGLLRRRRHDAPTSL